MNIRQGPAKSNFSNKTHPPVSTIDSKKLKYAIDENKWVTFNVSQKAKNREADGAANFDIADIAAITRATADKLEEYDKAIQLIDKINKGKASPEKKVADTGVICVALRLTGKIPKIDVV